MNMDTKGNQNEKKDDYDNSDLPVIDGCRYRLGGDDNKNQNRETRFYQRLSHGKNGAATLRRT
ncbi:hypothetical protein DESC_320014 [Desulfosarcina cetonica]|nr:hypothetical protein DESC_320014 [Desulfosarcina cetonica]